MACVQEQKNWRNVQCGCGHTAGAHGSEITQTGCMGIANDGQRAIACQCRNSAVDVVYAALQFSFNEICEHRERVRTRRVDVR
jgi:hypothetical protein